MNIGDQIKQKRERLGMTQKELADACHMPLYGERTIRRWEANECKPSKLELEAILNFPEEVSFPNPENAQYTAIDLFAGTGGIRLGFQETGMVETIWSSEIDKFAVKSYRANFGDTPHGDITKVNENTIPDHDILFGGFPCQAFSLAGLKRGFDDTRGTLFFDVARIIRAKRPKAFMLENVKNLVNHDHGNTFKVIISTLEELGYQVFYKVLKACDFGVPQNRERIYIVGFDRERFGNVEFQFPLPYDLKTRVGNILEAEVDPKYTLSDRLWAGHQERLVKHKAKGNGFGYSMFTADSPYTNTISARYYKDGSEILISQGEGKNPRKLTPREAARLQGYPDEYKIVVSDTQAYKQFGNAVSVPVINAIAHQIIYTLQQAEEENRG